MNKLSKQIGGTDIYLIDQILKGRFKSGQRVLDAGCGWGRNLKWFIKNNLEVYGVDFDPQKIIGIKSEYPHIKANFEVGNIENLIFEDAYFNHIICSAVLHFAVSSDQFKKMIVELVRVLQPRGSLFIRMASNFATNHPYQAIKNGIFQLRDGSERFLLDDELLKWVLNTQTVQMVEPLKTTNVSELRCMSTLVLEKI